MFNLLQKITFVFFRAFLYDIGNQYNNCNITEAKSPFQQKFLLHD